MACVCCGSQAGSVGLPCLNESPMLRKHSTPTPSHLHLRTSQWETSMEKPSVHLFCIARRHTGWNQTSERWTRQTKAQTPTAPLSFLAHINLSCLLRFLAVGFKVQSSDGLSLLFLIGSCQNMDSNSCQIGPSFFCESTPQS